MLSKVSLLWKIVILVTILVGLSLTLAKLSITEQFNSAVNEHYGESAMILAKLIASDPEIIAAFYEEEPHLYIQPIAESKRQVTEASYVIVTNLENIQYSHHKPSEIGKEMMFDSEEIIEDETSVIFQGEGYEGAATIAKTPIYDRNRNIIGVTTVGFYYDDLQSKVNNFNNATLPYYFVILLLGLLGAILISSNVRTMIFGLEPEEISYLFKEKEAILESINDPLIAVGVEGRIVSVNKKARDIHLFEDIEIDAFLKVPKLINCLTLIKEGTFHENNIKILIDDQVYIMNCSPIYQDNKLIGVVFIFHPYSELKELIGEVSKIKSFTDNMRAQNHEYQNKLNTIYGLIHLQKNEQALHLISQEVEQRQEFTNFLMYSVKNPLIAACLLGKKSRASELKVDLRIDENSELDLFPDTIDEKDVMTIIGNLIDNAMEAAIKKNGEAGVVLVSFTDLGPDIVFDIEDNGKGISPEEEKLIFEEGYTTKSSLNNGIGLSIVKNTLTILGGQLFISKSHLGGASITLIIPKTTYEAKLT
ncbi:sensor histidine kinase [Alkalihalophilus pseudofirmus]|uniref:histidine kinase n=1 Tax=Alkalihalophilus pseudofirmus TaxID=79885 RepID=A0AAJ2NQ73_ALKPS|nr:sensor histidine kinase [Alkalihalophilus pseudofirmus]MDV2886595.1 sensor histidine kinase [Alkalihalophilus pseudofirmus]